VLPVSRRLVPVLLFAALVAWPSSAAATGYVVNTSTDPDNGTGSCATGGSCSLRQAVNTANANPGADGITFAVTTANVTNGPGNNGIAVFGPVTIDGGGTTTIQRQSGFKLLSFISDGSSANIVSTVKNVTLQGTTGGDGGLVSVSASGAGLGVTLTLDHSTLQGNTTASGRGAGLTVSIAGGTLNVVDSTIAGNTEAGGERGGAIHVAVGGALNVTRSTIANNTATFGGAISLESGAGVAKVVSTTFSGNNTSSAFNQGAAIYEFAATGLQLSYNTFAGSSVGTDTVHTTGGPNVKLKGNVFAQNAIPDCKREPATPVLVSQGFNVFKVSGADACNLSNGDTFAALTLGALQNNGGPTQTQALPSGSPAINTGGLGGCTIVDAAAPVGVDQRGILRPQGNACDSGAFEFQAPANTAAPAITGTLAVGQVLTCSSGSWAGGTPLGFAFEWRRDGVAIAGAAASTYTVVAADAGHALTCRVTASNTAGSATADSAPVAVPAGGGVTPPGPGPGPTPDPGGGVTPPGGGGTPRPGGVPVDVVAPVLTAVTLTNRTFAVDTKGTAETPVASARKKAKKGTAFRYTLSETARVVFTISSRSAGRKVKGKCVAPSRANRKSPSCARVKRIGAFAQAAVAGANTKKFSGRIGRTALKPGSYQAVLSAKDARGNSAKVKTLTFTVVKK
jgi:CSLREA domain-containing protein